MIVWYLFTYIYIYIYIYICVHIYNREREREKAPCAQLHCSVDKSHNAGNSWLIYVYIYIRIHLFIYWFICNKREETREEGNGGGAPCAQLHRSAHNSHDTRDRWLISISICCKWILFSFKCKERERDQERGRERESERGGGVTSRAAALLLGLGPQRMRSLTLRNGGCESARGGETARNRRVYK